MTQDGTRTHGKAREDTTRHEKTRQGTRRQLLSFITFLFVLQIKGHLD